MTTKVRAFQATVMPKITQEKLDELAKSRLDSKSSKDVNVTSFLKKKRLEHGLSLGQVAEYLGLKVYTYMSYEASPEKSNHRPPSLTALINLSRLYNVSMDEILGLEKERSIVEVKYLNA